MELSSYSMNDFSEEENNNITETEEVFQDETVIVDEIIPSNYDEIIEEQYYVFN